MEKIGPFLGILILIMDIKARNRIRNRQNDKEEFGETIERWEKWVYLHKKAVYL